VLIGDIPAATAILDRFLHHAEEIQITGRSYRLRSHTPESTVAAKPKPAIPPTGSNGRKRDRLERRHSLIAQTLGNTKLNHHHAHTLPRLVLIRPPLAGSHVPGDTALSPLRDADWCPVRSHC